jgi:DNA modification methylase
LHATKKLHPFEKPPKLIQFLINQSSILGDTVLDTFCGSGRTILESKKLNRNAIGFELNHQHFLQAQARLMFPELESEEGKK